MDAIAGICETSAANSGRDANCESVFCRRATAVGC